MSKTNTPEPDRLDQLMVDAATQGLSPQDEAELSAALQQDPALRFEAEAYELAVTSVELALCDPDSSEALPAALRERLVASAGLHLPGAAPPLRLTDTPAVQTAPPKARFSLTDGRAFGWYAAAAALIALCIVLLQQPGDNNPTPVTDNKNQTPNSNTPGGLAVADPTERDYRALAEEPKTLQADWGFNADGGDPRFATASGEVIWNSDKQAGYMKLTGLPVNDPTKEQYQLWIVDPSRDAEPIDGGVFDITAAGQVIVPIDAKLRSDSPAVFAITIEKPGGVVVSEGPLQVVAAVRDAG